MLGFGDEKLFWCPSLDDAGNGTTTLNDLSGNGHHGTFVNMTSAAWTADASNNGVRCLLLSSASNQYVSHASFPNLNAGSLTIGFWFLQTTLASWVSVAGQGSGSAGISQYLQSGQIMGFRGNYSVGRIYSSAGAYSAGVWNHLVIESPRSAAASSCSAGVMYLNGAMIAPATGAFAIGTITGSGFTFGRGVTGDSALTGRIDDLRVWDSTIGEKRISQWYAGGRGFTPAAAGGLPLGRTLS